MVGKSIEKIDLCTECFKNKAEYLFLKSTFFSFFIRTFCKECAQKQSTREGLGVL